MKKIVVNKNFNKRYLKTSLELYLFPDQQNRISRKGVKYYLNYALNYVGVNGSKNSGWVQPTRWFIVTDSYLKLLDKLNDIAYNNLIDTVSSNKMNDDDWHRLFNYVTAFNATDRDKVWEYLLSLNLITEEEYQTSSISCRGFGQILKDSLVWTYNEQFDYYTLNHISPLSLEQRWDNSTNNVNSEQLYIMTSLPSFSGFNNYPDNVYITRGGIEQTAVKYYREDIGSYIYQMSYMAHTLTDRSGDGDIQFDYIDKIDYIDSLEMSFKLPKSIS